MKAVCYILLIVLIAVGTYPMQRQLLNSSDDPAKVIDPLSDGEEVPADTDDSMENDHDVAIEYRLQSRQLALDSNLHFDELEILFESQDPDIVIPPPRG